MALLPLPTDDFFLETVDAPPTQLLFKIESFSKLRNYHKSLPFSSGKSKWRLAIHTSGDRICLSLCVDGVDTLPEEWADNSSCSIMLFNHKSNKYLCFRGKEQQFDARNWKWGFSISKNMLTDPSNGYVVDDICIFGAEVLPHKIDSTQFLSFSEWEIPHLSRSEGVWTEEFFISNINCSITVYGGDREICVECCVPSPFENIRAEFCVRLGNKSSPHSYCSVTASYCFTDYSHTCEIPAPEKFTDYFNPSELPCFIETEITVKCEYSDLA